MGWPYQQKPPLGWPLDYNSGLVPNAGFWPMQEGSGNKVFDLSGNGNNGTLISALTWVLGEYGPAINFPGSDDYINVGSGASIDVSTNNFTIVIYGKSVDDTKGQAMLATRSSIANNPGYNFWWEGQTGDGRLTLSLDDAVNALSVSGTDHKLVTNVNAQYAVVVSRVAGLAQFYINGVVDSTAKDISVVTGSLTAGDTWIGDRPLGSREFFGVLDHAMLYMRILSASEIALLYREPFCMFKDPAEIALLGGYQAAAGINMPLLMQQMNQFNGGVAA